MSGRKKKNRSERQTAPARAEATTTLPGPAAKGPAGKREAPRPGPSRQGLLVQSSIAGLVLGIVMISLNLISVATSGEPLITRAPSAGGTGSPDAFPVPSPGGTAVPGSNPSAGPSATASPASPAAAGTVGPTAVVAQGIDPQVLESRTKGDPQAQVVITEWFDFL